MEEIMEEIVNETPSDPIDTSLKVACVGIGNAGGQVAVAAYDKGIPVFVLNTSVKDLDDAVMGREIKCHQVGDGRGSGKDRENAMALLKMGGKESIAAIFNNPYFQNVVEPADVVFVTFSTGGGTGSGIGPYVAQMIHKAYPNKVIIPYGILPKTVESVMAQANTIACVDDLVNIGTSYMLADLSFYENESQEIAFKKIGEYIAETMCCIRGDYLKYTANGMADERDVLTVISEPGYMTVHMKSGITDAMMTSKTLQGFLVDQVKSSPACRIQRDGLVQYSLLISNVNSAISDPMKAGDYTEFNSYVGEPKATYANYAVDDSQAQFTVIAISSGLTIPMDRFTVVRQKVQDNKAKFEKRSAFSLGADRKDSTLKGSSVKNIVMGSNGSQKADLSFLDD